MNRFKQYSKKKQVVAPRDYNFTPTKSLSTSTALHANTTTNTATPTATPTATATGTDTSSTPIVVQSDKPHKPVVYTRQKLVLSLNKRPPSPSITECKNKQQSVEQSQQFTPLVKLLANLLDPILPSTKTNNRATKTAEAIEILTKNRQAIQNNPTNHNHNSQLTDSSVPVNVSSTATARPMSANAVVRSVGRNRKRLSSDARVVPLDTSSAFTVEVLEQIAPNQIITDSVMKTEMESGTDFVGDTSTAEQVENDKYKKKDTQEWHSRQQQPVQQQQEQQQQQQEQQQQQQQQQQQEEEQQEQQQQEQQQQQQQQYQQQRQQQYQQQRQQQQSPSPQQPQLQSQSQHLQQQEQEQQQEQVQQQEQEQGQQRQQSELELQRLNAMGECNMGDMYPHSPTDRRNSPLHILYSNHSEIILRPRLRPRPPLPLLSSERGHGTHGEGHGYDASDSNRAVHMSKNKRIYQYMRNRVRMRHGVLQNDEDEEDETDTTPATLTGTAAVADLDARDSTNTHIIHLAHSMPLLSPLLSDTCKKYDTTANTISGTNAKRTNQSGSDHKNRIDDNLWNVQSSSIVDFTDTIELNLQSLLL